MSNHFIIESGDGRYWNTRTERFVSDRRAYDLGLRNDRTREANRDYQRSRLQHTKNRQHSD